MAIQYGTTGMLCVSHMNKVQYVPIKDVPLLMLPKVSNEQQVNSLSISPMQQTHLQIFGGLWGCRIVGTAAGLLNILKEQRGETVALGFCQRGLFEIQQVEAQAEQ